MRIPLVPPLAALIAGALVSRLAMPLETGELLAAGGAIAALALLAYWKSTRRAAMIACLAALFFAGALVEVAHRPGPAPELDAGSREIVILSGCVVEPPVFFDDREQFVLELEPGARARVSLYLREGEKPPPLRYGQRIELDGRVRRARNFQNPGSFDYAAYLARQDIYWTVSARAGANIRILRGACGSRLWGAIVGLRGAALDRLEALYQGDPYKAAMMQAVLIGESSRLEKVWTESFRRTGTYHALVISGLHVTVLAGFFLFLLRLCYCPEAAALGMTAAAAWLYALVSGWQAPVVRAAAGFTLFVVGRYFYRRRQLLNLLAAVAIGFLVCDPEQLFEASFQLSFLSVAALGALAVPILEKTSAPLGRGLPGLADVDRDPRLEPRVAHFRLELRLLAETVQWWTRIPQRWILGGMAASFRLLFYAYELVVISAAVQVGLVLPMAAYFHRLSITGLSANVLIVPAMSAVVPFGFAAILTGWKLPAVFAGALLTFARWIAEIHMRWEPGWRIPDPPLWLAVCFSIALLWIALLHRRDAETQRTHMLSLRLCVSAVISALLALIVLHPFRPDVRPGVLELTAIDVGQAESLFLAFPDGRLMMVDGGGFPNAGRRSRPRLDIGEDVVSPYLWSRSIRRLDTVVLSHAHEDHIGGLPAMLENFRPRELWTGAMPQGDAAWTALRRQAQRLGVRIVPLRAGRSFPYGGAVIEVLAPAVDYVPASAPGNDDSLAFRIRYGEHSFLLTGDMGRAGEDDLISAGTARKSEVLKVAHHGSRYSTSGLFLDLTKPAFAVISAGFENSYGLPHPKLLERLEERRAAVLRTDLWGLTSIRTDGRRLRLDTMRWSARDRRLRTAF